mgnify:CR=1 FL=1
MIISKDLYDKVEDGADIDINLSEGWIKTEDETIPMYQAATIYAEYLRSWWIDQFLE